MSKESLRKLYKEVRSSLTSTRRTEATDALLNKILPLISNYTYVLSYASIGDELNTTLLNEVLSSQLVLPKVVENDLHLFQPNNLLQLTQNSWGIPEPSPNDCQAIPPEKITLALIPALVFDRENHRLGYGRGYYDRLLPTLTNAHTIGIGFREQLTPEKLPIECHDVALKEIFLF